MADKTDVANAEVDVAAVSRTATDARHRADRVKDEEPTPAEEMDDVATQDDKADQTADAKAAGGVAEETTARGDAEKAGTATATKSPAAGSAAAGKDAKDAGKAAGKDGPATAKVKPVGAKPAEKAGPARGRTALSAVGSGVARVRNLIASLVWLAAVLCAAVLALGALFTALDQANESNEIVSWVLGRGRDLVGPFSDVFRLETAKNTLLVNWGIAALAYLVAGKILERVIRP